MAESKRPEDFQKKETPKKPDKATNEETIDQEIKASWDKTMGEFSEVIDSEGHRVRINHY